MTNPHTPTKAGEAASERERFEAKFPMPAGIEWQGEGYEVKDSYTNSYACDRYVARWIAWLAAKQDATPSPADRAASVGAVDEREAFEAYIRKDRGDLTTFGSGARMHYLNGYVNNAWLGWQARAALSKPAGEMAVMPAPVAWISTSELGKLVAGHAAFVTPGGGDDDIPLMRIA